MNVVTFECALASLRFTDINRTIRVIFGFAESPAYTAINKSVANWATPKERGFVISLGLLSTPLGAAKSLR
jgi:MFS family permease